MKQKLEQIFSFEESVGKTILKTAFIDDGVIIVFKDGTYLTFTEGHVVDEKFSMSDSVFVEMLIITEEQRQAYLDEETAERNRERTKQHEIYQKIMKKQNYEAYLKLKEEFENYEVETNN